MVQGRRPAAMLLMLSLLPLASCGGSEQADPAEETGQSPASPDSAPDGDDGGGEDGRGDGDADDEARTAEPDATQTEGEADADGDPTASPDSDDSSDGAPLPDGVEPVEDSELPGQSVATYYSRDGVHSEVIRVAYDDSLNVRALPGVVEDQIAQLDPDETAELAGRERLLGSNPWAEITLDDGVGWVNTYYLGFLGESEDLTEDYSDLGPTADPAVLVDMVAARAAAVGRDDTRYPYWTVTGAPAESQREDESQQWSIDLTMPGDDAALGVRLVVDLQAEGEAYSVAEVESIEICRRGVSEGNCL